MAYPATSVLSLTGTAGTPITAFLRNLVDYPKAEDINTALTEIIAIETVLGIAPNVSSGTGGSFATVDARLEAIDGSATTALIKNVILTNTSQTINIQSVALDETTPPDVSVVTTSLIPIMIFDGTLSITEQKIHFGLYTPADMDTAKASSMIISWCPTTAGASGNVNWKFYYKSTGIGSSFSGAETPIVLTVQAVSGTIYTHQSKTVDIPLSVFGSSSYNSFTIGRDTSATDTCTTAVGIVNIAFVYKCKQLAAGT
jgi:hypothetical protein